MELVVESIGFGSGDEYVIKELALSSVCGQHLAHYVFKPPKAWSSLSEATKQEYRRAMRDEHGICWGEGDIDYAQLGMTLKRAVERAVALYARGAEKCRLFSRLCARTFIDMDAEFGAPPASHTALKGKTCLLPCHAVPCMTCALNEAVCLSKWLNYYCQTLKINNLCCQTKSELKETASVDEVDAMSLKQEDCVCRRRRK